MSAERRCFISCDGCGEWEPWTNGGEETVGDARSTARRSGWLVSLPGGRDLCPDCRGGELGA